MIPKHKREEAITGKLLFTKIEGETLEDGREVMLVYGKLAVPTNSGVKSGYLYPIAGLGKSLTNAPIVSCFINTKVIEEVTKSLPKSIFNLFKPSTWKF
jgi:hypothetical protein